MATAQSLAVPQLPKFDLPRHNLESLTITWSANKIEAETAFADLLDEDREFVSALPYRRNKIDHVRFEGLGQPQNNEDEVVIVVRYDASGNWPSEPIPKGLQRSTEFLYRLAEIKSLNVQRCQAEFRWVDSSELNTFFPLPLDLGGSEEASLPIDEIVGVRGIKHAREDEEQKGYSFILERSGDRGLRLSLNFEVSSGPIARMPQQALLAAGHIARRLVFGIGAKK